MLEPAIDTGGPMGRMVLTVLGTVAEMELGLSVIGNAPAFAAMLAATSRFGREGYVSGRSLQI